MDQTWTDYAAVMAADVVPAASRWRGPLAAVPRHLFVPSWWERDGNDWVSIHGPSDMERWLTTAYQDTSLITRVGRQHADGLPGVRRSSGARPTSSSTHPSLLIQMYRHAILGEGLDVLDVGTGSGYGTALLATRLGGHRVTSVDIDAYLVKAARERLAGVGQVPEVVECDATVEVPGTYDRIIATVGISPIPAAWIKALRPGGRIVTVLDGTEAILTADMQDDGTLRGRIERDWAGFMSARHSDDYAPDDAGPGVRELLKRKADYSLVGQYPLADIADAWELHSTFVVQNPGIRHHWDVDEEGLATLLLWDENDSWARAQGARGMPPDVHLGGPVNLWQKLEGLKTRWLVEGRLPLYGAEARVERDGTIRLRRGAWTATIDAAV